MMSKSAYLALGMQEKVWCDHCLAWVGPCRHALEAALTEATQPKKGITISGTEATKALDAHLELFEAVVEWQKVHQSKQATVDAVARAVSRLSAAKEKSKKELAKYVDDLEKEKGEAA